MAAAGKKLAEALARAVAKNGGHGAGLFSVWTPDACVWSGAAGLDPAPGGGTRPATPADTFEIASITKTFTAALVLQLVDESRLTLDAPLGPRLPPGFSPALTARQLLAQRSGLADYWSDPPFVAPETNAFVRDFLADPDRLWQGPELLAYVPGLVQPGAPGKVWHYADTNFVLLALIVESLTGRPLHAAFRERLLAPLGLADTYLSYREPAASALPETHRFEEDLDLSGRRHQSADWGGGGLVSSTRDLARFLFALAGGKVLRPATLAAMRTFGPTGEKDISYGLGVYGIVLDDGLGQLWGHDGHGSSFAFHWPEKGLVFAGTLNQTESDWWPLVEAALAVFG